MMWTLTLTQRQLDKLKRLPLDEEISNKESIIYQTNALPHNKVVPNTLLNYLRDLGFGEGLLTAFLSVYTTADNKNVSDYFDDIPKAKLTQVHMLFSKD